MRGVKMKSILYFAKEALLDELHAVAVYSKLAEYYRYKNEELSAKFKKLANMEKGHANFWMEFLKRRGYDVSTVKVNKLKVAFWILLFRVLGLGLTFKILESSEGGAIKMYSKMLEGGELSESEKAVLRGILEDELIHENTFAEEETRFKEFVEHIRDAVLGMNDGLVEVLSVSAGLVGVYGNPLYVALGGLIVGIGGALSMGIGALTSVRAQKQVRLGTLSRLGIAAKYATHILTSKVIGYLKKWGLREEEAKTIAEEVKRRGMLDKIVAEEEYGIKEEKLENPIKAGLYTGVFYAIGAFIPLTPYFLMLPIKMALLLSFIMAALMLSLMGFLIAIIAELDIKMKVLELVTTGLGSAIITFAIGRLASIILGIEIS